ncbi:MAG: hypothetical protein WCW78_02045 [Candidatus Paceibacterota bacterium]|jgi:hypothetical protein
MSIQDDKVIFDMPRAKRSLAFFLFLGVLEMVFSFFLYFSLAGRIFAPHQSEAAPGIPNLISFQGRLTDTSGNPLGGTGTPYCFRYSVYDAQAAGNKLWPAGTPGTSTTTVVDGVFSDQIGRVDALDYDFISTSTIFLQVDVNTVASTCSGSWEPLTPRQQLTSSPYAQSSENIYGNAIRTPTSTKVQIGTGAGVASGQTLFSLDVINIGESIGGTCNSNNGTMWYNSALSRSLVCENNVISVLSNSSTTIAGIGTNATAPITAGNIVFSNSNGVSFGQNGSTITASAAGGGGGGYALDDFANISWRGFITNVTNMTAISQRPIFVPFVLPGSITWNQMELEVSRVTSGSNLFTAQIGLYTYVNGTQISLLGSLQNTYSGTNTASQSGVRRIILTGMQSQGTTLSPGIYVLGLNFSAAATASMNYSLRGGQTIGPAVGNIGPGANAYTTASSQLSSLAIHRFLGRYSATSGAFPASVGFNQVQQYTSGAAVYFHIQST